MGCVNEKQRRIPARNAKKETITEPDIVPDETDIRNFKT